MGKGRTRAYIEGGRVMKNTWCVYCHTFPNGKRYIGITKQKPEDRWLDGMGYSAQPKVFAAIVKF